MPAGQTNNVLFVDVGASHTTATVATYFQKNITAYDKVASLEIKAVASARVGVSSPSDAIPGS